jgi:peptidyl-prolyl cis-trans isomerase SDCCAG10
MEAEIRRLTKKQGGGDSDDEPAKKKPKKSYLEEELAKYSKGRGMYKKGKEGKRRDETDILAALDSFRGKLKNTAFGTTGETATEEASGNGVGEEKEGGAVGEEISTMEVDNDTGFMGHALHFPKDDGEESAKAERDYEVIDPRQRGARAREEERERKRVQKAKGSSSSRYRR